MDQIEFLRTKLYEVIEKGNTNDILKVSQELDELILYCMSDQFNVSRRKNTLNSLAHAYTGKIQ